MAPTGSEANPSSWRDVYALVRDSRSDVLDAVGDVNDRVDILVIKFNAHEVTHATESALAAGQSKGEQRILGFARSSIALAVSIIGSITAIAVALGKP